MAGVKGRSGPPGNKHGATHKIFSDTLRKALVQDQLDKQRLFKGIQKVLDKCEEGDLPALQFVADRTDGKPYQQVALTGEDGGPVRVAQVMWADE
jgi:hypothetical protein